MAVTYDFQTPGVSTSAADTQEDIRNIAEMSWVWHVNASPHSLTNKPTGLIEAFYTGSSNNQNYYNLRAYDGTNLVKVNFKELFVDLDGPVLTNTVGARGNEFIAMGVAPGYYCESLAPWSIHADYGNTGTSTYDPILALVNQGTERARIYTDTSDSHKLKFDVGGSDQMVIDSSGDVGIGTPTSSGKLNIKGEYSNYILSMYAQGGAQIGGLWQDASGHSELYLKNSSGVSKVLLSSKSASYFLGGNVGIGTSSPVSGSLLTVDGDMAIGSTSDSYSEIRFFDSLQSGTTRVRSEYLALKFFIGNTQRMEIASSGNVSVSNGNLVIGTSGKGIDFSATSGTGTSELLDDYEEGTFTPTFIDTNGDATFTHDVQKGRYTKVGDCVYFSLTIGTDSVTAGTGDLIISGLPFTAQNSESQIRPSGAVGINYSWGTSPTHWQISSNSDEIILYKSLNPITTSKSADCDTSINDNRLFMHGFYFV